MADSGKDLNDYTVIELKNFLQILGAKTSGAKAELIQRLSSLNKEAGTNAWYVPELINQSTEEDNDEEEVTRGQETQQETTIPENMQREIDLLRRERDLLERELKLAQREINTSPNSTVSVISSMSIRAIGDLLNEFHGDETYWKWEKQVQLLRMTYGLDDNSSRVLISSRLRGKALSWFHSKPDHLELSVDQLLERMKEMFDLRPSKLALRKSFERRIWQNKESFSDYFHDKVILANRVPVDDEELTDYIIDGISG